LTQINASLISPDDDGGAALVVVLGQTVVRQLFAAAENPIGAVMQVKGVPLRVIGILHQGPDALWHGAMGIFFGYYPARKAA
jgi:hypothetical protein